MRTTTAVSESTVLRLTGAIYDAALEPSRWPGMLEQLADALRGTLTTIFLHDFRTLDGTSVWSVRADPEYERRYAEYYNARNVYVTAKPDAVSLGRVLTTDDLCPEHDVLRSEIHADWMAPQDIFWTTGAAVLQEQSAFAMVSSMRPHRAPPFGREEILLQQALVPHFQRALQIQRRLHGSDQVLEGAASVFDRLPTGVVLLDERDRPFVINARAQLILDDGDGLRASVDGLQAATPRETAELRRAVTAAREATLGRGVGHGGTVSLPRPSGKRPLSVLVTPLPAERIHMGRTTACVAVFVTDPEHAPDALPDTLARLYGLTRAEGRLVAKLAEGATLSTAADECAVSLHTVRTQLKVIFSKTGTSRQSELLRLVLTGPAVLRRPDAGPAIDRLTGTSAGPART